MPAPVTISLVDADGDLGDILAPDQLERARHEALARVQRLSPGEWDRKPRSSTSPTTAAS